MNFLGQLVLAQSMLGAVAHYLTNIKGSTLMEIHEIAEIVIENTTDIKQLDQKFSFLEKVIKVTDDQFDLQKESLQALNKKMDWQFTEVDKKFDKVDQRFEQVDKRFEQVDKRFEQVDKRFEQVDQRFEQVDKRFDQIDKRFEQVDKRFEQVDRRFDLIDRRFDEVNLKFADMGQRLVEINQSINQKFADQADIMRGKILYPIFIMFAGTLLVQFISGPIAKKLFGL